MRNKTEIKVYLPIKMVGELERHRQNNNRSYFIEKAIRARLDDEDAFSFSDISNRQLMAMLHSRLSERNDASAHILKEMLLQELKE